MVLDDDDRGSKRSRTESSSSSGTTEVFLRLIALSLVEPNVCWAWLFG
jgi:hypothetical protein